MPTKASFPPPKWPGAVIYTGVFSFSVEGIKT